MKPRIESERLPEPYRTEHAAAVLARDDALRAIICALVDRHRDQFPSLSEARARAWEGAGHIARTIESAGDNLNAAPFGPDLAGPVMAYRNSLKAESLAIHAMLAALIPDRTTDPTECAPLPPR